MKWVPWPHLGSTGLEDKPHLQAELLNTAWLQTPPPKVATGSSEQPARRSRQGDEGVCALNASVLAPVCTLLPPNLFSWM